MTNATHSVHLVTEHRFRVPCEQPWGGNWQDFGVAQAMAENVAKDHGIKTTTDDWSRFQVDDEGFSIVLKVEQKASDIAERVGEILGDQIDELVEARALGTNYESAVSYLTKQIAAAVFGTSVETW